MGGPRIRDCKTLFFSFFLGLLGYTFGEESVYLLRLISMLNWLLKLTNVVLVHWKLESISNFFLDEFTHCSCVCTLMCIWKEVSWIWGNIALIMRTPPQGSSKRIKRGHQFFASRHKTITQTQYLAIVPQVRRIKQRLFSQLLVILNPLCTLFYASILTASYKTKTFE